MSDFCRFASNFRSMSFGSHQLVSEPSDPVLKSSKEGSSGLGESGGGSPEGRRVPVDEARILSIEDTMRTLSGTVLDLKIQFEKFKGKFDRRMEELTMSDRDLEVPTQILSNSSQTFDQTPFQYYSTASHTHMSNSPIHANISHPWNGSPPLMHTAMSVPEQTPEERIEILTVAYQKYKARRDSKAFEEPLQKHNDELLNVSSTFPSSLLSASANDSNRSGSCREDIDKHSYNSSRSVEDSMFPQLLHFSKGLAKETANFTFQVFIMNHPGQMGSGYVHVLDCPISHIVVKVAEVVTKIDRQSEKEIEEELIDPVRVWDPGIKLQFQVARASVTGTMSHKLCF